jgi:predicted Zn-dependent peptidase
MAICLSGDIEPEYAIRMIDKTFGSFAKQPLEPFVPQKEDPILKHETYEVFGPEAESMIMGYRFNGSNSIDSDILTMMSFMLYNGKAGLLDMDLNLKQKVLESFCEAYLLKDYSILFLGGSPTQGQTLEDMQKLFLEEIEKLKKGDFPEWLPQATITNLKLKMMTELESNRDRAGALVDVFIKDESWEKYINSINRLSKITKQQIVDFAKNNMNDNYVLVYKRTGEDKNMVKVTKPEITPVETNRDKKSDYAKNFNAENVVELKPEFIDFSKEINRTTVNGVEMFSVRNTTNTLFGLDFIVPMGSAHSKLLPLAFDYISYAGTSKMSAEQLQTELFKLGCDFKVSCEENQSKITITGLDENKGKATELIELLIRDVQTNEEIMQNVIAQNLQVRDDIKKNKGVILQQAMVNYAKFGATNPFNNVLSDADLKNLKSEKLVQLLKSLFNFKHQIHYYGPSTAEIASQEIQKYHLVPTSLMQPQFESNFTEKPIKENTALYVDFDMQQAEVLFLSKIVAFDSTLIPISKIHNQYFGAGLNSVVGQTLRESKALAYSVFSSISVPKTNLRSIYGVSYIGTQADKLYEATLGMKSLLDTVPLALDMFEETKKSIVQKTNSERVSKKEILPSFYAAKQLGLSQDSRKATYELAKTIKLDDLSKFHNKYIANNNISYLMIGKKDKILSSGFSKFAAPTEIKKEQIFGF